MEQVISITTMSWLVCTGVLWPVYDYCANLGGSADKGQPGGGLGSVIPGGDGGAAAAETTAQKKFNARAAAKIARGPSKGSALTAAEIAARAKKAAKRAGRKGGAME